MNIASYKQLALFIGIVATLVALFYISQSCDRQQPIYLPDAPITPATSPALDAQAVRDSTLADSFLRHVSPAVPSRPRRLIVQ